MVQNIREHTFETNSSSLHTIAIYDGTNAVEKLREFDSLNSDIKLGDFGWEKEVYTDPFDILTYIWTLICCHYPQYKETIREYMPKTNFIEPKLDAYGCVDCWEGYVDHGGCYDTDFDEIMSTEGNLAQVLFYGRLATWNDNTDTDEDPEHLEPKDAVKIYWKCN